MEAVTRSISLTAAGPACRRSRGANRSDTRSASSNAVFWQGDQEFFAADARQKVCHPQVFGQAARDSSQSTQSPAAWPNLSFNTT